MRVGMKSAVLSVVGVLACGSMAFSQPVRGVWSALGAEETIQGSIEEIQQIPGQRPGMVGLRFVVASSTGDPVTVLVGPAYYLAQAGYSPKVGDKISVEGFMIQSDVDKIMVARTITAGALTIPLRDEQGMPLWSGGARFPAQFAPQSKLCEPALILARGYGRYGNQGGSRPSGAPGAGISTPQGGQGTGVCPLGYPAGTGVNRPSSQGLQNSPRGVAPSFPNR
jgi:hypothetical protein